MSTLTDEQKAELQLLKAYQNVFLNTVEGQMVFWDLINECHVFRPFNMMNAGAYKLEGKREMGLHLMNMVEFSELHGGPGPDGMERIRQSLGRTAQYTHKPNKEEQDG